MGRIITGDNLDAMRSLETDSVDLCYLDPPFNSGRTWAEFGDQWSTAPVCAEALSVLRGGCPAAVRVIDLEAPRGVAAYMTFMAIRLFEIRRLLRRTGSIYLHCDDSAVHRLRLVMDAIFGAGNYRNDIAWRRTESHNDARRYARLADRILFYRMSKDGTWNPQFRPYTEETIRTQFCYRDARGRYSAENIIGKALMGVTYTYEYNGISSSDWIYPRHRIDELEAAGRLHITSSGRPWRKRYLDEAKGVPFADMITDINRAGPAERVGYPTQKPVELLDLFVAASSNRGETVLDPFCGTGTALLAAKRLGRDWIGIDISPTATALAQERLDGLLL